MCDDVFRTRVIANTIMDQYEDDISHETLQDPKGHVIVGMSWRASRRTASRHSTLCHCLSSYWSSIAMTTSKTCKRYTYCWSWLPWRWSCNHMNRGWCIITSYLNPYISNPTDLGKLMVFTKIVRIGATLLRSTRPRSTTCRRKRHATRYLPQCFSRKSSTVKLATR